MDTTITLNPHETPRDAHALHHAVNVATRPARSRVLWARPTPDRLIVRSPYRPDWGMIPGAVNAATLATPTITVGQRVEWALIASPTKAVGPRDEHGRLTARSKRVPLPEPEWGAWARRKLDGALHIDTIDVEGLPAAWSRRGITLTRVAYAGTATVTDPAVLARLADDGVGPGKAFGCGLLTTRGTP